MSARVLALSICVVACGVERAPPPPARGATPAPPPAPVPVPPGTTEACAQVIVVAWHGAEYAADTITRDDDAARGRAGELLAQLEQQGADFGDLARAESDAASSGPRRGLLGTYTREEWPEVHLPIRDAVFRLQVGQVSPVIRTPYGFVIARRCPTEMAHTRHILIRYHGARNAGTNITRTREEAQRIAEDLRGRLDAPGADFAAMAREHSEDASAAEGGDVGTLGRGRFNEAYETAAFALEPYQISTVVESEFGFHLIQRLPI